MGEIHSAFVIEVQYHEYNNKPFFYISLSSSHGLWGSRHKWLKGILSIIEEQRSIKKLDKLWEKDDNFIHELTQAYQIMKKLELETLQLDKFRAKVWESAHAIIKNFCKNENVAHVSPTFQSKTNSPVDVLTYRPSILK